MSNPTPVYPLPASLDARDLAAYDAAVPSRANHKSSLASVIQNILALFASGIGLTNILPAFGGLFFGLPTVTPGSVVSHVSTVTVQLYDILGNAITAVSGVDWWLSDTAGGAASTTAPSSAVTASTGTLVLTSSIHGAAGTALTSASGILALVVTQSATHNYYLNVRIAGKVVSSTVITFP